jgi:hypothetical protein
LGTPITILAKRGWQRVFELRGVEFRGDVELGGVELRGVVEQLVSELWSSVSGYLFLNYLALTNVLKFVGSADRLCIS